MRFINFMPAVVCLSMFQWGCEEELTQAFSDVRAAAPDICSDYCIAKSECEWPALDGDKRREAFSAAIRKCVVECAWYQEEGAYVADNEYTEEGFKNYPHHVSGDEIIQSLECLFELTVYECVFAEHSAHYTFKPGTEKKCEDAPKCIKPLKANIKLKWNAKEGLMGTCEKAGTQTIDAPYFWSYKAQTPSS